MITKSNAGTRLRNLSKMTKANNGTRTLAESIMSAEVLHAITQWINSSEPSNRGVLIGGIAYSFWGKPRYTEDSDLLFLSEADIQKAQEKAVSNKNFKRIAPHTLEEKQTQAEVQTLSPAFLDMPHFIAVKIIQTAVESSGLKIASVEGIIASKISMKNIRSKDETDIIELLKVYDVDMQGWGIDKSLFSTLKTKAEREKQNQLSE